MRYVLEYLWVLLSSALFTLANSLPSGRARRAISALVTVIAIIVVVAAGLIIIVFLLIVPTSVSTSTIYP